MQRKTVLSMKLTPSKSEAKEDATTNSDPIEDESLERQERFPSRLRTTTGTGNTERSAADRRNEILSQQLKALNGELQTKLRAKTLENSQLKLELSKIRSEHDKDVRRAVLQQKSSTEMMARTLKHAEDVIKEKEQMISRQQETINKMSLAKTLSPRMSPPSSSSSLGVRGQSFHGRTNNQRAADARGISSTDADKPVRKFTRSASLRSNNSVTALSSAPRKLSLASQKQPMQQKLQVVQEVKNLRELVASLTQECQSVKSERDAYYAKSANLESIVKSLREAAEKRKELERECEEAKAQLSEKQNEIKQLHKDELVGRRKYQEVIESLESKLRELEKRCALQNVLYEELGLEMSSVQKQASRSKSGVNLTSSEVQTSPESETSTPDSALSSSVRMVNGEGSRLALQQQQQKPRLGTQKTDSGLGSSLDESVSSRRTDSSTRSSTFRQHLLHPLFESVDRAVDAGPSEDQKLSVYVAKYAYNPAKISPNHDIADLELELKKGEFVIVFGDIDEDGYFEGETLDGRHGLVPSNYVERLPPEELVDFHASYPNNPALTTSNAKASSSRVTQSSVHFSTNTNPGTVPGASGSVALFDSRSVGGLVQHSSGSTARGATMDFRSDNSNTRPSDFSQKLPSTHSSSAAKRETSSEDPNVPPPSNLTLEKQMHKSIMIGWVPAPATFVECYNVYVNRALKTTIRGNERCRALVEGIDLSFCHRVSVRSCTGAGRESLDSLCTILVGKDCPVMPAELRVINISATSATVTWIPANSSYQHTIFVNEREYVTVPASSHHIVIPDLLPNTDYKIHIVPVVPKSTVSFSNYLQACAQIGFKTLPDNVPDPPATLQLESGPQDGTLLLTWTPVIPPANCDVTGYAIYADGQRVQQIDSPTGDHALLDITRLQPPLPRTLTVRTISSKNVSRDSPFLSVTEDVLLGHVKAVAQAQSTDHTHLTPLTPLPPVSPSTGSRQNTVTFRDPPNSRQGPPPQINVTAPNRIPPEYYGQNEEQLMDIMEETEDQMMGRRPMFDSYGRRIPQPFGQRNMAGRPNTLPPGARDFGPPPGPGGFMGPPRHSGPMSFPARPFENMSIGSFPPGGPHGFHGPRGPFPPGMPRFGPRFEGPPGRRGPFGGPNPFGEPFFEGRRLDVPFGMYERTTSLPQIEITKDDSFESMDSRHRAYSDREAEERGYYRGGPRGRFDSPPNDPASRRMRSQSRDRFDMEGPSRYSRGNQDRFQGGPMLNNYASLDRRGMQRQQQRPPREVPRGKYEYPDEGTKRRDESEGRGRGQQSSVQSGGGSNMQGGNLDKIKNKLVRLFRTNRDFDAATESPNADAAAEELSFRANELIKVTGTKDQDGFYQGEMIGTGRQGMVGCNLVTVVDDERLVRKYLGEEATVDRPRPSALKGGNKGPNVTIKEPTRGPIKKMIAKYDYEVSNSPNPDFEKELSFKKGDVIYVSGIMDEDGFFEGEHQASGKQGLVPSNYLIDPATEGTTAAAATSSSSTLTRNPSLRERDPSASRSTNQQGQQQQQRPSSANPQHRQIATAEVHGGAQPKR